jgi:hypothetical protein
VNGACKLEVRSSLENRSMRDKEVRERRESKCLFQTRSFPLTTLPSRERLISCGFFGQTFFFVQLAASLPKHDVGQVLYDKFLTSFLD